MKELELYADNQQIEQIIKSVGQGIIVYNLDLSYKLWNPFMEKISKIPASEVIGKYPLDVFPFLKEAGVMERLSKVVSGEEVDSIDFPYKISDNGESGWVTDKSVPLYDTNGEIIGVIGFVTDITVRKKEEEALKDYLQIINHDLRAQISTMINFAELIGDEDNSIEDHQIFGELISRTGKKTIKMMGNYLLLVKIEQNKANFEKNKKTVLELIDTIKIVFFSFKSKITSKLILRKPESDLLNFNLLGRKVLINENLFESMIINLISNAIEALGEQNGELLFHIYEEDNSLCLSFSNSGEIPEEVRQKLFKKFSSGKKNGNGLGLYSSKLIAQAHNGDLLYEPFPGGTRFIIKIPVEN